MLLNYALGPQAQRLKHKDICESGSKGVIIRLPQYADQRPKALKDYTEGIMDLIMPDRFVIDYYGKQEIIFFGPDEGTAPLMGDVAYLAEEKSYPYWRTITTFFYMYIFFSAFWRAHYAASVDRRATPSGWLPYCSVTER